MFSEGSSKPLTAEDIRFTTKGGVLYAIAQGWPRDGKLRIQSLAEGSALAPGAIENVQAVGDSDSLTFTRNHRWLEVKLPERLAGAPAVALKIRGSALA
jgi:alpha-L-fucosidase